MTDPQKPKSPLDAILDDEDKMFALPDPEAPPPIPPPTTQTIEPAIEPAAAPTPPSVVATPEPPPSAAPTPPEPSPATTPVAAPVPPAAAAPPAEPPPPAEPADGGPWKAKREAERREKEALAELNAAREREAQLLRDLEASRRPPTPPPTAPPLATDETDPLLVVEDRIAKMEREITEQRQRNEQLQAAVQRQSRDTLLRTEADQFSREHPDFPQARDFYIQKQIEEAELTGELDTVAADIRQRVPGEVSKAARERGITEAALSRELAQAVLFEQRLTLMERTAAQRGKSVVETVYELARVRGFTGAPRTVTPTVVPANGNTPPPAAASAAETLRREQAQAAASSLATMPTSPAAPATPGALTYSGFLAMDAAAQARTMDQLDRAAQYGLVPSNWVEELQAGRPVAVPDAAQLEQRVKESTGAVPF